MARDLKELNQATSSGIILLCHSIQNTYRDNPDSYSPFHSDYEIIRLLNSLYRAGLLEPQTFTYPLTESVYQEMLFQDKIHTLDYYTSSDPQWSELYQQRKQLEHHTFDQDLVGKLIDPKLLNHLGTYQLAVIVNAPVQSVRMKPMLYTNVLRMLVPGGFFLADHRKKSDLTIIPNSPTRCLLESSVITTNTQAETFVRYQLPVTRKQRYCPKPKSVTKSIRLDRQLIYQKTVANVYPDLLI